VLQIAGIAAGVLGYEALVHRLAVAGGGQGPGPLLAIAPLLFAGSWLIWLRSRVLSAVLAAAVLGIWLLLHAAHAAMPDLKLLYPVPHIAAHLVLLWFFGRTLYPGEVALVTRIARYEHGNLPPDIERYTRQVTWAWCIYFAVMAIVSATLFATAPLSTWSWFANVLNVPLLAAMFVVEYAVRLLRFPNFSHASFLAAFRAFRAVGRASVIQGR
jgi:uncharacterized membrane protein